MGTPPLSPRATQSWISTPRSTNDGGTNNVTAPRGTNNGVAPGSSSAAGLGGHRQVATNNVRAPSGGATTPRQPRLPTIVPNDNSTIELMPVPRRRSEARGAGELKRELNSLRLRSMNRKEIKAADFKKAVKEFQEEKLPLLECAEKTTRKFRLKRDNYWTRLEYSEKIEATTEAFNKNLAALKKEYIAEMKAYLGSASDEQVKAKIQKLMDDALEKG